MSCSKAVPGGAGLYRFAQENLTRSLDPTPARVRQKLDVGLRYLNWLTIHSSTADLFEGTHLDFGAGMHPAIPLLYFCLGVERQYLFDAAPLLNRELVDETVKVFRQIVTELGWPLRFFMRRLPELNAEKELSWTEYLKQMGISYFAPGNAKFPEITGTVDIVTCTQVLSYIGQEELRNCFRQLYQSLKVGRKSFGHSSPQWRGRCIRKWPFAIQPFEIFACRVEKAH